MHWQDGILIIELVVLLLIYFDDHVMRRMAEESLVISKESLEAQKAYLKLREAWYAARLKKKDNDKADVGLSPSNNENNQQRS